MQKLHILGHAQTAMQKNQSKLHPEDGFEPRELVLKLLLRLSSVSFHGTASVGEGVCVRAISGTKQISMPF